MPGLPLDNTKSIKGAMRRFSTWVRAPNHVWTRRTCHIMGRLHKSKTRGGYPYLQKPDILITTV